MAVPIAEYQKLSAISQLSNIWSDSFSVFCFQFQDSYHENKTVKLLSSMGRLDDIRTALKPLKKFGKKWNKFHDHFRIKLFNFKLNIKELSFHRQMF